MIISHRLKLIYAKAHKVAGTSTELSLSRHCGPDDIVAPVGRFDPKVDETEYVWPSQNCPPQTDCHLDVCQIRERVTPKEWDGYTKVVNVRNPWDMMVSFYFWWRGLNERPPDMPDTFSEFVFWNLKGSCPVNLSSWQMEGELWADYHIRFEHIESDCQGLFYRLGVGYNGLPRLKTKKVERDQYPRYYNNETRDLVKECYGEMIEYFGYCFER